MNKFYKVVAERAHLGRGNTSPITFYFKAENAFHALQKTKHQKGIKRSHIPLLVEEVSEEEYRQNIKISAYVRSGVRSP